jgi:two-component system, NarL family, nitrate/nitrite response regulator NarL
VEIVGCASSGEEALRLAEALEPDVVLVDVELGEEDGIALTRTLEANAPSTRIVLISAHERSDLGDMLTDGRALLFLPKSDLGAAAIERLLR